jgi:hypothetical protein
MAERYFKHKRELKLPLRKWGTRWKYEQKQQILVGSGGSSNFGKISKHHRYRMITYTNLRYYEMLGLLTASATNAREVHVFKPDV